jgi:hypothetical protein
VHHHIARIHQHPIAVRHAFNAQMLRTGFFQRMHQMIGKRTDMTLRATAGDDDRVGNGGFALHVQREDILGFIVLKRGEDQSGGVGGRKAACGAGVFRLRLAG